MTELGLSLVGTRPPSATGSRPSSSTGYYYPPSPKTPKSYCNGTAYQDRIFRSQSPSQSTHNVTRTNDSRDRTRHGSGKKKSKPSYVDETLFGNTEASWRAPWNTDKKSKPLLYDGTNYKQAKAMLSGRSSTPQKSSNQNATFNVRSPSNKNRYKPKPSFVDETLFGPRLDEPSFSSPWDKTRGKEPEYVFDATDYKAAAERKAAKAAAAEAETRSNKEAWRPPSRSASARPSSASSSRPSSRQSTQIPKPKHHQSSYADEMLFGPKLADPGFPAPWEKREKKPDLFNMTDYKAGPSARDRKRQESARGDQRPAWK